MAAADTEIGRALVAAVAAEELIKVLVRLFELVGKSF
jgi:hypothetical protein